MSHMRLTAAVLATFLSAQALLAGGEPPKPSTPETDPQNPGLWNTEAMMENAVQQLTRRYNLNKDQEDFTRKLLTLRVRKFLKEHEHELRGLLTEAIQFNLNPKSADSARMKEWADRAMPVFEAARTAILDGNHEWGEILNADQKKIHQRDLDQMDVNFGDMQTKFTKWSNGQFSPDDLSPKPRPAKVGRSVAAPEGAVSTPEDVWESWINQMVAIYKFTPEQEKSAKAILEDCRAEAGKYRDKHKDQLDRLAARIKELRGKSDKADELRKIEEEQKALLKPVDVDLFNKLKDRVNALATDAQRAQYEAMRDKQKRKQEKDKAEQEKIWRDRGEKLRSTTQPATQPADTKKPEAKATQP